MHQHEKINYVEFGAADLTATKAFFQRAFDWQFVDYGPDYCAFSNQGIDGGFFKSDRVSTVHSGGALIVFYSADLEATLTKVQGAGARIAKEIFAFPGGRRFHFIEPGDNEFAVWSDG